VRRPAHALFQDDAIDHHVEVVGFLPIELDLVAEVDHLAVDPGAHEALAAQALELELELAFSSAAHGGQDREARALAHGLDPVDDLLDRLRLDALHAAARAMGDAHARIEEAEVVGDLGHGADGRPR
jgi:hypothetical protein